MQEVIWDKGGIVRAEECGSFVAEGILAFQGLFCVELVAPYRESSHVVFCLCKFSRGVLLRDRVVVVSSAVVRQNKHCRHYTPK